MKYINHILILLILSVMVSPGHAQDTLINKALLKGLIDSLFEDTIVHQPPAITRNPEIFMSPDSLDATVEYGSADSN